MAILNILYVMFGLISIKHQNGNMAKKVQKIIIFNRLRYVWFGNFLWGDIGISKKSQGRSTQKPQVSIKSQTGVMVKKLQKITIFKRLRDVWFGNFFMRWYKNIREVTRVIYAKTPGLY